MDNLSFGAHVKYNGTAVEFRGYDDESRTRAHVVYLDGEQAGKTVTVGTSDLSNA